MSEDAITFEGDEIQAFAGVLHRSKEPIEVPLLLGEYVQLKVVAHVAEVNHKENQRTGVLEREHHLKIIDIQVVQDET